MIELQHDELVFQFPEVHADAACRVDFQRTLRIPDDNREYPLPPGLGRFPLAHVEEHCSRLPAGWIERSGVMLPMYQAEALWISFSSESGSQTGVSYPFAVKIAAGRINAVTGDEWSNGLVKDPQDYLVVPDQPWLDGFCVQKGLIRQFVAMPLGQGYTAEEQLSGAAEHGGIQIIVYPMKRERYEEILERSTRAFGADVCYSVAEPCMSAAMGLAPGGLMRQEIYEDEYGYDAWDMSRSSRCFVHILNSAQWTIATGKPVPGQQPSAADYTKAGLPWFEYYDDKLGALDGAKKLAGLDSVAAKGVKLGEKPIVENDAVKPQKIVPLGSGAAKVSEGKW
ncbi:MAG: hypothetical protein ING90_15250 [Rhodocyclaceae bacterium]|nr:hypothetical protein [Rhodocyclaceae bacterium]